MANVYITPANHFEKDVNGGRKLYPYLKLDLMAGIYQTLATPAHRPSPTVVDNSASSTFPFPRG